jgi:predicted amidohydrolase
MTRRDLLAAAGALAVTEAASAAEPAPGPRYTALALQTRCDAVNQDADPVAARARMMRAVERIGREVRASAGFIRTFNGTETKLVVLPEYVLTGFPLGETRDQWKAKASVDPTGREVEALAKLAEGVKLFLAVNLYENDPKFPALYFQSTLVFAPSGDVVLRYRRMISLYTPSPFDVWDAFLDAYGYDAAFPVAKTEIGTLAAIASEEILYPEIARMTAMKGAEVFLHPTSEVGAPGLTPKDVAKRARATENMAWLVSANTSEIAGTPVPARSTDGMSKIVDWKGQVVAEAGYGETMVANATIDLAASRAARRNGGMTHFLSRQPWDAYAKGYADAPGAEPNGSAAAPIERDQVLKRQRAVIDRLIDKGVVR